MRKLAIILGLFICLNSFSQGDLGLNGYFAKLEYKAFAPQNATQEMQSFLGANAGVYLGEFVAIGVAYYGSLNELAYLEDRVSGFNLVGGPYADGMDYLTIAEKLKKEVDTKYGGLTIEAFAESFNMFHISMPILLGYGVSKIYNVAYDPTAYPALGSFDPPEDPNELRKYEYRSYFVEKDGFFVIEPGINMNVILHDYVSLTLGASYKMIKDNTWNNINKAHLDVQKGMNFNIGVKAIIR